MPDIIIADNNIKRMSVLLILCIIMFVLLAFYMLYNLMTGTGSIYMKIIWIVLLGLLGVAFYYIYITYFSTNSTLVSTVYLNGKTQTVIDSKTLTSPNSANSAFGVWIYVNSWNSSSEKVVFSTSGQELSLVFDSTQPSLYCRIQTGCSSSNSHIESILITDSFPMQKWTYIIVSLNGPFVDCFFDGKLITSHKLVNVATTLSCTDRVWSINMGLGFDAYAYNLIRYTYAMNPQQAYSTFYSTAPSGSNTGLLAGMNINLAIVTNDDTCHATTIL